MSARKSVSPKARRHFLGAGTEACNAIDMPHCSSSGSALRPKKPGTPNVR